jgi:hypothetical protein
VCRSQPPAMSFSVSPLEITDAQILYASGRDVPILLKNSLIWMGDFSYENPTALYFTYK